MVSATHCNPMSRSSIPILLCYSSSCSARMILRTVIDGTISGSVASLWLWNTKTWWRQSSLTSYSSNLKTPTLSWTECTEPQVQGILIPQLSVTRFAECTSIKLGKSSCWPPAHSIPSGWMTTLSCCSRTSHPKHWPWDMLLNHSHLFCWRNIWSTSGGFSLLDYLIFFPSGIWMHRDLPPNCRLPCSTIMVLTIFSPCAPATCCSPLLHYSPPERALLQYGDVFVLHSATEPYCLC